MEAFHSQCHERTAHRLPGQESMPANSALRGLRSEGMSVISLPHHLPDVSDSWIEISSRTSSASLTSANDANIIHTERPSRHLRPSPIIDQLPPRSTSTAGSSQDEYEESESESDRVMSSSNEDIQEDDDETSTALGVGTLDKVFTPQPNAFSHPPSATPYRRHVPDSYFPAQTQRDATTTQRSYQRNVQSRPRPSSYQPDHDAALRASLTTLLSCAAAVRPKHTDPHLQRPTPPRTSTQPTALRLVPESELNNINSPQTRRTASPKPPKRKSREASKERAAKKARAAATAKALSTPSDEVMSPTLATWMISAGVVLVFSAISFSAGYAWGREVGRFEGEMGLPGGGCSREVLRGGGKIRWSNATSSIRA
jgi:hypothetical protein